jgi:hypothetical protein
MKRLLWSAGVILILMTGASSYAQPNLLTNPGFEEGYTGWTTFGTGPQLSTPSTDNIARTDTASSKVFGEYTGCPSGSFTAGGYFQEFVATGSLVYEFSGYGYVSSNDTIPGASTCNGNRAVAQVAFYASGVPIARNDVVIADYSAPRDEWFSFSASMQAPPTADHVRCYILFLQPACDDGSVFLDDLSFQERWPQGVPLNYLANPSFSNGLDGWVTFENVFADFRVFARRSPDAGAKMFGPFPTPPPAEPVTSGMYQKFAATPGSEWELSVWAMTTCEEDPITEGNGNFCTAKIVFRDSGGSDLDFFEQVIIDTTSPLGTWTQSAVSGVAPTGTDSVFAYLLFVQPPPFEGGAAFFDDVVLRKVYTASGVPDLSPDASFTLYQNAPNPFNPTTRISFDLSEADAVELSVYDALGRHVTTLVERTMSAGPHSVTWDGRTGNGTAAATGVYWYRLKTSTGQSSRRMVLLK